MILRPAALLSRGRITRGQTSGHGQPDVWPYQAGGDMAAAHSAPVCSAWFRLPDLRFARAAQVACHSVDLILRNTRRSACSMR
ncbi:hypothetical protein BE15_00840 [Sorangium cellulosum]|uniref:Uncharacterized protein n=1 Tax=Sorangium cellulosum TaxID=56 RepID=A0A150QQ17_SORCE|nr:hypothetical protein BE15_00840 [Sorangium cellulosum]